MKILIRKATLSVAGLFSHFHRQTGRAGRFGVAGVGLCLLLDLPSARAVNFHVATAQDLQSALYLSATNGFANTIYVTNGYYLDSGSFHYASSGTNSLTLLAEPGVASSAIVLDSGGTGSSLNIVCTVPCQITVQGMTFLRNCGNVNLGGLQIAAPGSAIVVNGCEFLSPTNSSGCGLVITAGANAIVTNCIATGSIIGSGGTGIDISGVTNNVIVQASTLTTNNSGSGNYGGGLYVSGAVIVAVTKCLFTGNSADYNGGGAYLSSAYGNISLLGNTFTGNSAVWNGGGGVCFSGGTNATLAGNTFTGNWVSNYYTTFGGGAYCYNISGSVSLANNNFTGNSASSINSSYSSYGGGFCCQNIYGTISLTNNNFIGNSASSLNLYACGYGGGFYCNSTVTAPVSLYGNTFQNNTSQVGGGLCASASNINLLDNLVFNNVATNFNSNGSSQGGGIWVNASATNNMINNTVTGNSATGSGGSGGGVAFIIGGVVEYLNIFNNIIWGNKATAGNGGDVYLNGTGKQKFFSYNDVDNQAGPKWDLAVSNIDRLPLFFDPINGDYHTQTNSTCKAAGSTNAPSLPATDLDGSPRISAGTVDMGCYQFITTVAHPADVNGDFVITPAEFNAYAAAWTNGLPWATGPSPIPANYLTRAGYLMTNGGAYYNAGSARPLNWRLIGH